MSANSKPASNPSEKAKNTPQDISEKNSNIEQYFALKVISQSTTNNVPPRIAKQKDLLYKYINIPYINSITKYVLSNLLDHYFRVKFIGFDEPTKRNNPKVPLIYISNHSGMAFPWDAMAFLSGLLKKRNFNIHQVPRTIVSPMLTKAHYMNPYLIRDFWKKNSGVNATSINFEMLMQYSANDVMIYPEGIAGIGKGFNNKYQLQSLSTSAIRMSIKYKTDIIPFATINGEYINPYSYSFNFINKLSSKINIPFLPIGIMILLIIIFPWLFYFGFPAKLTFVRGKRIKPYQMTNKPYQELTRKDFKAITAKVRAQLQPQMDKAVAQYGKKPYNFSELYKHIKNNFAEMLPYFPPLWPILFATHERLYKQNKNRLIQAAQAGKRSMPIEMYDFYNSKLTNPSQLEPQSPPTQTQKNTSKTNPKPLTQQDFVVPHQTPAQKLKAMSITLLKNPLLLLYYIPVIGLIAGLLAHLMRTRKK